MSFCDFSLLCLQLAPADPPAPVRLPSLYEKRDRVRAESSPQLPWVGGGDLQRVYWCHLSHPNGVELVSLRQWAVQAEGQS